MSGNSKKRCRKNKELQALENNFVQLKFYSLIDQSRGYAQKLLSNKDNTWNELNLITSRFPYFFISILLVYVVLVRIVHCFDYLPRAFVCITVEFWCPITALQYILYYLLCNSKIGESVLSL